MLRNKGRQSWDLAGRAPRRKARAFRPNGSLAALEERMLPAVAVAIEPAAAHAITAAPAAALGFTTKATLPNATIGKTIQDKIVTHGGTAPVTFTVTKGTLPAGVTLSKSGLLSGKPTKAGKSTFTITAKDATAATVSRAFTLTTAAAAAGPEVTKLQRFGFHTQPTIFVLTFNEALKAGPAEDVANYKLVPIVNGVAGSPIAIASATYDNANHTVTLATTNRVYLFERYQLTVNGKPTKGLTNTAGTFLAGSGGKAGTDFVETFGPAILAGPNLPTVNPV
jgi:hypothetical protein